MDVNADGVPDLVTSLGHDYGIFWYEQKREAAGKRGWVKHLIDDGWSQAHAMTLADLNHDGRPELVTGKRYYADEKDPGANQTLGVYWYEALNREGSQWRRHILDYGTRTGAGLQIPVVDIDGDGDWMSLSREKRACTSLKIFLHSDESSVDWRRKRCRPC